MKFAYDISIIIPCYNCSKFVDETMKSLREQTYDYNKMEILLINDGSKDNTLDVLKKYDDKNVIVIDKENEGVSKTRNLGIQKSHGKYLLFLDPDDYLSKNAIEDIIKFFDKHYDEIDMVTYPMILFYPNGRKKMHSRYKKDFDNSNHIYDLNDNYLLVQATINVCIKNNKEYAFDTNQFYSEDEQFNTKILMNKKKLGYVASAKYFYRQHASSITARKENFDFEGVYSFHDEYLRKYNNHPYVQSVVINNLRWRINEDCLYPYDLKKNKIDKYLESVTNRLSNIDFSLYKEYLKERMLLNLISLSRQKCVVKKNDDSYSLLCNDKVVIDEITSNNYIYSYELNNDKLKLYGRVDTALYYYDNVRLMAKFYYKDKQVIEREIPLSYTIDAFKYYEREYVLNLDLTRIKKISFYLLVNDERVKLNTLPEDWCSKNKVINKYNMKIKNGIKFKNKLLRKFTNRFVWSKNLNFYIINFLSFFMFKYYHKVVYFGDKDSLIYEMYRKDKDTNKIFISNAKGIKYKLLILSCQKVITNKKYKEVLPFGGMCEKYVQASRFIVEIVGE